MGVSVRNSITGRGGVARSRRGLFAGGLAALVAGCGDEARYEQKVLAISCPEAVRISDRGEPIGVVSGHVRYCWPGEASCYCDADNDCYAQDGYVPCTPPSAADAGADALADVADARADVRADSTTDAADARADVAVDAAADAPPADAGDPRATLGSWGALQPWPFAAVHSSLLPNKQVLFWSDDHDTVPYLWNPANGAFTATTFTRTELHCAGHSFLSDGRLLITGGEPVDQMGAGVGVTDVNLYNYSTGTFTAGPTMRDLRWYPTNTTLANGEVLVTAGTRNDPGQDNLIPEIYGTNGALRSLTGASRALETYPFMYLAPNGMVFQAGPYHDTWYIDTAGVGRWVPLTAMNAAVRYWSSSVMYDDGRVFVAGGATSDTAAPFASAEVIDLRAATPRWTYTSPMAQGRRDLNATLLPDGTVFVAGGTGVGGAFVLEPEIWDPATGAFTRLAPAAQGRAYHSETLLLADGRVLFAGGNDYRLHSNAQVYSPPYLFRGARPTVSSAPTTVGYGAAITVSTPDAATASGITWIRLGSTTHGFDQNQRINRFAVTPVTGGVQMTTPSDRRLCPPGHYLLFLLNNRGVPSVARVIRIR